MSLDLIGQARLLYQHAAGLTPRFAHLQGDGATEDTLAYFRDVPDFRNYTLLELPHTARWPALPPSPTATMPPPSCATSCTAP
jgi:ring-1,2-phenylacetyl-CoA epoxidase subunit PaaC